jgi:hypothetical protein
MAITLNQHRAGITQSVIALFSDDQTPQEGFSAFFPPVTTVDKQVSIEVERNRQLVAVDVKRATDANRNIFDKSTEKIFVPPYYNETFDFTSTQRYDVIFATIAGGGNPNVYDLRALIGSGAAYALKLKNKIARAKELQRAQVLQTGIVTLVNGDSIDFKRQASSLVQLSGANTWDQPTTCVPLTNLATGAKFIREQGLSIGNEFAVIMGEDAFNNFMASTQLQNQAKFFNQIERTDISFPQMNKVTGFTWQGRASQGSYKFNIYTYPSFYEAVDGTKTYYLNPKNVVILPDDFVGNTAHAGVPSIMGNAVDGLYVAPMQGEYYTRDLIDQRRKTWDFEVSSAPVAVPISVDRIFTIATT